MAQVMTRINGMCVTKTRNTDAAQSSTASRMIPAFLALSCESGRFFTMYSAKLSICVKLLFRTSRIFGLRLFFCRSAEDAPKRKLYRLAVKIGICPSFLCKLLKTFLFLHHSISIIAYAAKNFKKKFSKGLDFFCKSRYNVI